MIAMQEYLGAYSADDKGNLVFHEGALVRAARKGAWVILDELNLAPADVLEALNRLFDDNHELFVPELQETIKPHPQFMLFGTQNPAGAYAGLPSLRNPSALLSCIKDVVARQWCDAYLGYSAVPRPQTQQQGAVLQAAKCCPVL